METNDIEKHTRSFGLSFAITSVISAVLVIIKESNEDTVLAWMKAATGHHWVTHGIIVIVLFAAMGWALSKLNNNQGLTLSANALISCIAASVLVSGLLIAGFYIQCPTRKPPMPPIADLGSNDPLILERILGSFPMECSNRIAQFFHL